MNSNTLKRTAATLGVVAGLLAAAGPASAQILDGPLMAKAGPQHEAGGFKGELIGLEPNALGTQVGSEGRASTFFGGLGNDTLDTGAGASFTLDVASSEVFELNTFGLPENEGAAVGVRENGSQGAKAVLTAPVRLA